MLAQTGFHWTIAGSANAVFELKAMSMHPIGFVVGSKEYLTPVLSFFGDPQPR